MDYDVTEETPVIAQDCNAGQSTAESFYACPTQMEDASNPVPAPPKKKSGKMLILTICASVLVLALAVGCAFFAVRATSPEARLLRAWNGTMEDLNDVTANAEIFNALVEQSKSYKDKSTTTVNYLMNMETDYFQEKNSITVRTHRDRTNHRMLVDGALEMEYSYEDYEEFNSSTEIAYEIYVDSESLVLSLPDLLDDSYMLPTEHFGEKLLDSELGDFLADELDEETLELLGKLDIDLTALMDPKLTELCPEEYRLFTESISIEKCDKEIDLADGLEQVYEVSFDMSALLDLAFATADQLLINSVGDISDSLPEDFIEELQDLEDEVRDTLEELEYTILLGVGDGKLRAFYLELTSDGEPHDLTLVLAGEDNIWSEILLYADDEEVLSGSIVKKKAGFNVTLESDGEKLVIVVDDKDQEIDVKFDGEKLFTVTYDVENDCIFFGYELSEDGYELSYSVEVAPLEKFEKPEDSVDLLSLSEDELEELGEELMEALEDMG